MDPISMIVGALVNGASTALNDTASQAVKDSYQGLKSLVTEYWNNKKDDNVNEAKVFLDNLEEEPEAFQIPFENKFIKVIPVPDKALVEQAQQLCKLLDDSGFSQGKYNVTVNNSQGVQVGDKNIQNNKF